MTMKRAILCLLFLFVSIPAVSLAANDAGVAAIDSGQPEQAATETPADKLHDPASNPSAAWSDMKAAKKVGWPLAVFAGLVLLCKLLARAKNYAMFSALGKGKTAVIVGATGALAASCYNAAVDGGAWTAVLLSGLVGLAHYIDAGSPGQQKSGRSKK